MFEPRVVFLRLEPHLIPGRSSLQIQQDWQNIRAYFSAVQEQLTSIIRLGDFLSTTIDASQPVPTVLAEVDNWLRP